MTPETPDVTEQPEPLLIQVGARSSEGLEFSWDFGDPDGKEVAFMPTGELVDANAEQRGDDAAYVFRGPGPWTITMTAKRKGS